MSSIVFLRNKKNGKVYAYVNEKTLDETTGRSVYRRKCIGHLDYSQGEIVPNRPRSGPPLPSVRPVGTRMLLTSISESTGLTDSLKRTFPADWERVLECSMYLVSTRYQLSDIGLWEMSHADTEDEPMTSDDVLSLLGRISSGDISAFMRRWADRNRSDIYYSMAAYPAVSYSDRNIMSLSEDFVLQPVYNLEMCFSGWMPISYVMHSVDIEGLDSLFDGNNRFSDLGVPGLCHVVRPSLCGGADLDGLIGGRRDFLMMLPRDSPVFLAMVAELKEEVFASDTGRTRTAVSETARIRQGRRRIFAHLLYDAELAESETSAFLELIERCRKELIRGHRVPRNEELYRRFFLDTPDGFEINSEAVMSVNEYSGWSVILTDTIADADRAMELYRLNLMSERFFDDINSEKDRIELKLYSEQRISARMFLNFLALILRCSLKNALDVYPGRRYTPDEALSIAEHVCSVRMPGRKNSVLCQLSEEQRAVFEAASLYGGRKGDSERQ